MVQNKLSINELGYDNEKTNFKPIPVQFPE